MNSSRSLFLIPLLLMAFALMARAEAPVKQTPGKPVATAKLQRLDPHGAPDSALKTMKLAEHPECLVCHINAAGKLSTKPEPEALCAGCHGRLPHSGVVEHMGEEPGGGAGLNCLGCHRPHRAAAEGSTITERKPSPLIRTHLPENLPKGLIENRYTRDNKGHTAGDAMVDHPCSECHSF
ncbi:MAG TPA: hypothetical protein DCS07_03735 [Bdellovibrionales bacterium]|nr:MAG: hypothetical protein A2Z97_09315 [Bdellovibrionales bacterium GWB1_52_6]OFZ04131.1 MAG: hypothetical protein A2X97_15135 [Bdellovibrionales bacterium GWA1_52_35]OFZ33211.1 MAG: hypothetical protein A2070_01185 [Bdellovibrionales bacterium GWC1_52_8]HAR41730.1 hypothetical protein [Bdellovibrionales bacterium]HCM40471.1 hypothetical protein [Bdellovibrionales bacterium]